MLNSIHLADSGSLKSDQNGIEKVVIQELGTTERLLKSDQNGIENFFLHHLQLEKQVLKSDQNGIENV